MIYIVDIEAVETRYTAQWKKYLPKQIERHTSQKVTTISGGETPQATTPGAFLNFGGTNVYKSKQSICKMVSWANRRNPVLWIRLFRLFAF